jgi:hypothetical protein
MGWGSGRKIILIDTRQESYDSYSSRSKFKKQEFDKNKSTYEVLFLQYLSRTVVEIDDIMLCILSRVVAKN